MNGYEKHFSRFISNLKKKNFYEAHEDLEVLWYKKRFEDSDEVRVLKGFINASVSFELFKKGKVEASKRVWKTYLKYRDLVEYLESDYKAKCIEVMYEIERVKKNFIN